jgi:tRNA nucleotidyltransferase (CCA-adding enzyme)
MNRLKMYRVGGVVRDTLLGVKSKDIDLAVEAESFDEMREEVIKRGGKIFVETPQYFTIRAKLPGIGDVDFSLCRKDGIYKDGRRPESVEKATILEDLARRDFTVNAMAQDIDTNEFLDPFNGREDLKNRIIRCVGDPHHRFAEDSLRILRAVRFAITKEFAIDNLTCFAMKENQHLMKSLPVERIREELSRTFAHNSANTIEILNTLKMNWIFEHFNLKLVPTIYT